ncbi:type ISP restriction/modification enzyme [Adlercreutzia sp. ZJ154]|uniref:DEAD/DEAH box helicase n=1 Tax=Adlercreutzia sp. ZJ154 TaxID=2709790 RepID=UPI0013EDBA40|nr:type ISP restriction/modification enzyme [Adlercreutzia sp. ZJ154]
MASGNKEIARSNLSNASSKTVYEALASILDESQTAKEQGTKYEALCAYFLKADPFWSNFYSRVGTLEQAAAWPDSPVYGQNQDIGIDLLAQTAVGGEWHAIQCKCYDPEKPLPKGVCDSFFAALMNNDDFSGWLIMTSAGGPGRNLEAQMSGDLSCFIDTAKMAASGLDWSHFIDGLPPEKRVTYDPRPHQREAIDSILTAFGEQDRCKAIMACGTGKTLMSLRLTEEWLNGNPGVVLFCAPSISLVGQSMREWMAQARIPISPLVVCSDAKASRRGGEDSMPMTLADFEYPATTNPESLMRSYEAHRRSNRDGAIVVFSTYQSIDVIHQAQGLGLPEFDLIICDEAHRTTGNALPGVSTTEASAFMKVHYDENVRAKKRLYMTATPRIYGETAKRKGAEEDYTIASMDDEGIYGTTAYQIKFGEAVEKKLLTDYKVVVLTVQEDALADRLPSLESDQGVNARTLEPSDIGKIIGCWKGLIDHGEGAPEDATGLGDMLVVDDMGQIDSDALPLHRAVGFCSTIDASKTICEAFSQIIDDYAGDAPDDLPLKCDLRHVDGNMPADRRARNIAWLGEDVADDECRILTNARCLAEGIDVPNLDAVIFFNAKNSTVDVVQAVGRVMRRAEGKDYGYIILPIFVPAGMTPEEALDDSKVFANVWSILQALRSHDERIEAKVNALALHQAASQNKYQGAADHKGWDEGLESRKEAEQRKAAEIAEGVQLRLSLYPAERWEKAVKTQLVKKCGTRIYWDEWAEDVARIAERHIERIGALIKDDEGIKEQFEVFLKGLRDSLNPGITEDEAVQMIAQHIITVPVFEALFGDYEFAKSNPVSIAIDSFLTSLQGHQLDEASDAEVLNDVYKSVQRRAAMVRSDTARQQLIRDLYEKFFKVAFKATSEKMGVVYTPTEIIDYILRETDRVLRSEFGCSLADEGVHILDPFAGTGSFIAHLIESDLIPDDKLGYKYRHELHSNEILLLAYYIMAVNIEYAYHQRMADAGKDEDYVPFEGAVLTDTFQMTEEGDTLDTEVFTQNSERVLQQNELPIKVIVGNPPYSVGQKNANDNNANESYPTLDSNIARTYAANTKATLKASLYDSYIRAFRWASDRIDKEGVVCFVSNAGWVDGQAMDGFRKCLADEFDSIHVFHLRGNQRTQGDESKREGGKVFGSGSRAPIAITMLVKNPNAKEHGIFYHDIGDYLTREEKLAIVRRAACDGIADWQQITPDRHNDWLNQRDDSWYEFAPIGLEKYKEPQGIFTTWSCGLKTQRDPWAWGYSESSVKADMRRLIEGMNAQIEQCGGDEKKVEYDTKKYSWTWRLLDFAKKGELVGYTPEHVVLGMYRPFCKQYVYYDTKMNERTSQQPRLFPFAGSEGKKVEMTYQQYSPLLPNLVIDTSERGVIISNILPDLELMHHGQCFPLYWYEKQKAAGGLFVESDGGYVRHDAITDEALGVFRSVYPRAFAGRKKKDGGEDLTKEDIFFYIYGILHSSEYRKRFASNLKKELPRIPFARDFKTFSRAGRALADLHLNYETIQPYPLEEEGDSENPGRTEKMRFGKCKRDEEHPKGEDRTVLQVAENLTLKGIPEEAYGYVVNGKSAIGWLMDRYRVTVDKASGIANDPNEYSDNPHYIVDLTKRVVRVSLETNEIVGNLPPIDELPQSECFPFAWKVK